jgi:hypothetical protein
MPCPSLDVASELKLYPLCTKRVFDFGCRYSSLYLDSQPHDKHNVRDYSHFLGPQFGQENAIFDQDQYSH